MSNRMESNYHLANKKHLFYNFKKFFAYIKKDPFKHIPLTFHIKQGINDPQWNIFLKYYKKK